MPTNRDAPLVARHRLSGPYFRLTFRHPEVAQEARAGQFVMIKAGTTADLPLRRPFSILAIEPAAGTFDLFVKTVGAGSHGLTSLEPGEPAQCLGPLGRPFDPAPAGTEAVMVAGGYGIAPFLFFATELRRRRQSCHVFYGGRTAADLQIREPFEALGARLTLATEDGTVGVRGRVTEPLERYLDEASGPLHLYACGPDAMLHAVARVAERRDLPAAVSLDPWMGCGVGTCLGCVVRIQYRDEEKPKYRCACTEGPVFDAEAVVWGRESQSWVRRRRTAAGGA